MTTSQTAHLTRPGDNHTGITLHPELVAEMIEGTTEFGPTSRGTAEALVTNRARAARDAQPTATMPPARDLPLERLPVLDKLGARLAFERTGTRLYEAMIGKLDVHGTFRGGPSRADLELLRDEEQRHLVLAHHLITRLGGDPTVVTPHANLQAVVSKGLVELVTDPRTNLVDCLDAMIIAELTDHESWELLVRAIASIGDRQAEAQLREAARTEGVHLTKLRAWLAAATELTARPGD